MILKRIVQLKVNNDPINKDKTSTRSQSANVTNHFLDFVLKIYIAFYLLSLFFHNPIGHRPMRIQTYIYNNMIDSILFYSIP